MNDRDTTDQRQFSSGRSGVKGDNWTDGDVVAQSDQPDEPDFEWPQDACVWRARWQLPTGPGSGWNGEHGQYFECPYRRPPIEPLRNVCCLLEEEVDGPVGRCPFEGLLEFVG